MKAKKIKFIIVIVIMLLIAAFFLIPLGKQDENLVTNSVEINNYPEIVFNELNNVKNAEKWIKNGDTPEDYSVQFSNDTDTASSLVRIDFLNKENVQKITRVSNNTTETSSMSVLFKLKERNHHTPSIYVYCNVYPQKHLIANTGESVNTTLLNVTYGINYSNVSFFSKSIGKWKVILNFEKEAESYSINIGNAIKSHVEDNIGQLLDNR